MTQENELTWSGVKRCLRNWGLKFIPHKQEGIEIFPFDGDWRYAQFASNPKDAFSIGEEFARTIARHENFINRARERSYC